MRASSVLAAAGLLSSVSAAIKGFNYGANFNNKQLPGTDGWTSARLYTM
jgi:glucan endo-1,3-beta-D-glucosidase